MRRLLPLLLLAFLAAPVSAAAQDGERLSRLEDEVARLSAMRSGTGGSGMNSAAASQMDMRLNQLEQQIQTLTGNLERVQHQNAVLQQQFARLQQDMEVRFNELRQQMAQMQQQQMMAAQQAAAAAAAPTALVPAPAGTDAEEEKTDAATADTSGAQPLYDEGFNKLRQADYSGAEKAFKQFMASYGSHQLAGNANYWLGETYYVRGQFKEAAVTFADGYQKYPKNSKAPDNLLKLAMSLSSLGSKEDACLTLSELKNKYPNSAPTIRTRAEQERKKLGCKA